MGFTLASLRTHHFQVTELLFACLYHLILDFLETYVRNENTQDTKERKELHRQALSSNKISELRLNGAFFNKPQS
jgi:hypothetical protein